MRARSSGSEKIVVLRRPWPSSDLRVKRNIILIRPTTINRPDVLLGCNPSMNADLAHQASSPRRSSTAEKYKREIRAVTRRALLQIPEHPDERSEPIVFPQWRPPKRHFPSSTIPSRRSSLPAGVSHPSDPRRQSRYRERPSARARSRQDIDWGSQSRVPLISQIDARAAALSAGEWRDALKTPTINATAWEPQGRELHHKRCTTRLRQRYVDLSTTRLTLSKGDQGQPARKDSASPDSGAFAWNQTPPLRWDSVIHSVFDEDDSDGQSPKRVSTWNCFGWKLTIGPREYSEKN
jgi:uncharacterized protein YdaU (DUF1376 family)